MIAPHLSILVAMARNRVIGKENALPWYVPEDLKRFKSLTMGHVLIMGRKTFESIGRPLPGRTNIIVTRQSNFHVEGAEVVHSLQEALQAGKQDNSPEPDIRRFIIGGAELYRQTIILSQTMYLTEIQRAFDGDTYFPEFDRREWHEIDREQHFLPDKTGKETPLEYHFVTLVRRNAIASSLNS